MKGQAKTEKSEPEVRRVKFDANDKILHSLFVADEIYEKSILASNVTFKKATAFASLLWIFLTLMIHYFSPKDSFERLTGVEQNASILAVALLFISNVSRIIPLIYTGGSRSFSSVIIGSIVVQSIAMTTDALMAFTPTPVVIDPITKCRVHLMRWGEWIPLAFLMTFLTEGLNLQEQDNRISPAFFEGICQALSTSVGLLIPFAPNLLSWSLGLVLAGILFCRIHVRCIQKYKLLCATRQGQSVCEIEQYERIYYSFKLIATCAAMWSLLVVLYIATWVAPIFATKDSLLTSPALPMLTQTFCEIWSKILYLVVIVDAHNSLFDEAIRAGRRLEELRNMMSVVWESSNDVITISLRKKETGKVLTMVSPTYRKLSQALQRQKHYKDESNSFEKALIFELRKDDFISEQESFNDSFNNSFNSTSNTAATLTTKIKAKPKNIRSLELDKSKSNGNKRENVKIRHFPSISNNSKQTENEKLSEDVGLLAVAELMVKAWQTAGQTVGNEDSVIIHDFEHHINEDAKSQEEHSSVVKIRCEARVTRLNDDSIVVIIRDVSERFRRFEAEKLIVKETTARKKDAEANRFTRHEVKNGLLSAIAITDNLREMLNWEKCRNSSERKPGFIHGLSSITESSQENQQSGKFLQNSAYNDVLELDDTLREILDTILAQSMAKDLIHEAYEPNVERVDIYSVLHGSRNDSRFPLVTFPNPLPSFLFDPQLLRYVHRNAISNACKYGQKNGVVRTEIRFDSDKSEFQMDVINLPGEYHEEILELGEKAEEAVFAPEKRLHPYLKRKSIGMISTKSSTVMPSRPSLENLKDLNSSGDGAWIMRKCAKTLGGKVSIKFFPDKTVFTLRCPAKPIVVRKKTNVTIDSQTFHLPQNTWGIAIDDSKIQRKLMERFLSILGINKDRIFVRGKDANEIQDFSEFVVNKIQKNSNDYFLVIADENLDFVVDSTNHNSMSGSRCVEEIRNRLDIELEKNMLALVRSANDSSDDIAIYNKRAHAFLPKVPIEKDRVFDIISSLWRKRFILESNFVSGTNPQQSPANDQEDVSITSAEVMVTVESIDALFDNFSSNSWHSLNEKLHVLKGDLKSLYDNKRVITISNDIDSLREATDPTNFVEQWNLLRSKILPLL